MIHKYKKIIIFIAIVNSFLFIMSCGDSPDKARIGLSKMNINFDEATFVERVKEGDIVVVKLFIKAGMNPNSKGHDRIGSLAWSISKNYTEISKLLINGGAKPDDPINRIRFFMLKDDIKGHPGFMYWVSEYITNVSDHYFTPLMGAIIKNNNDVVNALLDKGASPNESASDSITPIMIAILTDNVEILQKLIQKGADPNKRNVKKLSALDMVKDHNTKVGKILKGVTNLK